MPDNSKLGILDWGIGGVSIYKLIKQKMPHAPVTYFSDTGATPYGKMQRDELIGRLNAVIGFLKTNGVTHLVIGCNAASTAIAFLNDDGIKIEGVIETAVDFAKQKKPAKLGLIGGRRTVVSGVYRRKFAAYDIKLNQRVAQPLSGLIESGDISSEKLRSEARKILGPLKNCSHILLACTHYPAITNVLRDFVSPNTMFLDPAENLVGKILKWGLSSGGGDIFFTSGDPGAMQKAARNAFNVEIEKVTKVTI